VHPLLSRVCSVTVICEREKTKSDLRENTKNRCSSAKLLHAMAPKFRRGIQVIRAFQRRSPSQSSHTCPLQLVVLVALSLTKRSISYPSSSCRSHVPMVARALLQLPMQMLVNEYLGGGVCPGCTSSNTSFSLYCVKAEHSTYLTAPSSRAIRSPSSRLTGAILCFASLSFTELSSLRSTCVPTIRHGTPGQWWCTSGNHFSRTFSKDAGEVTEKHTRKTSVWGYERGRRRS
jgi:hypothetical protein